MTVAILVPAKSKSRRIPKKNLQKLGDHTLVEHCLQKLLRCDNIDKIILDSDVDEVLDLGRPYATDDNRLVLQKRSTELLGDDVGTPQLCEHILLQDEAIEFLGIMHVTAPFLSERNIKKCVDVFVTCKDVYDSLFTVEVLHDYIWKDKPLNFNVDCRTGTDEVDIFYKLTGGFFMSTRKYILENKSFIGRNPILYPVPVLEALDINYPNELELARIIHKGMSAGLA